MAKAPLHLVFIAGLLMNLQQCGWAARFALDGDSPVGLFMGVGDVFLLAWTYWLYCRQRHTHVWPLTAFCVLQFVYLIYQYPQFKEIYPNDSYVKFLFITLPNAKWQAGDLWGCAYLMFSASFLPFMILVAAAGWYRFYKLQALRGK
jgi:hypothetical protein